MKLISLGSSSDGNCHILYTNGVGIMLDCGINVRNINAVIKDYNIKHILLTHKHKDHISSILENKIVDKGQFIYGNEDVIDKIKDTKYINKVTLEKNKKYVIDDNFYIVTFEIPHDVMNFGYLIHDNSTNTNTVYITDIGYISNLNFDNVTNFIIECNYDDDLYQEISKDDEGYVRYARTMGIFGHISVQECSDFINRNVGINTLNVVLLHISRNFDYKEIEEKFKSMVERKDLNIKAINNNIIGKEEITLIDTSKYDDIRLDEIMDFDAFEDIF